MWKNEETCDSGSCNTSGNTMAIGLGPFQFLAVSPQEPHESAPTAAGTDSTAAF